MHVHRFGILHLEVIASKVLYANILQDGVCDLFIPQAKVVRLSLLRFGLLWLEVHEFDLMRLRASWNFTLKPKLLRLIIQKPRAFL
jgi:hypothetical protein